MTRVFVSHSSQDKERFVRGFAGRLVDAGLAVWYDEWSLRPGDSLVDRIIEEGLGRSDVVIAVVSQHSIESDWVRKELNVAVVSEIGRRCRIIPVIIDAVDMPVKLQDLLYQRIPDTSSYDREFDRVLDGIRAVGHGHDGFMMSRSPVPAATRAVLPPAPGRFVNREKELAKLDEVLAESEDAQRPCVAMLFGLPGTGKSALAAKWGNSVSDRFPDGVLYADFALRGGDALPDIGDVLTGLLEDLGVRDEALPADLEAQRATYRRLTASKRLLVVVENATQPAQVKQALPQGHGSVMIATAGNYMGELVMDAKVSAEPVPLNPLDETDAVAVLRTMAGTRSRRDADEDLVELGILCGGLPIALAFCGSHLNRHPKWTVRDFISEIQAADDKLAAVSGDYVRHALDAIYRSFDDRLGAFYRRLGLYPGNTLGPECAALIAAVAQSDATRLLRELHDAQLLIDAGRGRYEMHRLVHEHMAAVCIADEPQPVREELRVSLIEWYHGALRLADRAIAKERLRVAADVDVVSPTGFPEFPTASAAYDWFATERHNIVEVLQLADSLGRAELVWQMAESLWLMFLGRRSFADWQKCDSLGVAAAKACGHRDAEARLRSHLARAYAELGQHAHAGREMREALELVQASDNAALRASIRESQGTCEFLAGDNVSALASFDEVRAQMSALGRQRSIAIADLLRSRVFNAEQRYAEATVAARSCRTAFEQLGDDVNAAKAALEAGKAAAASSWSDDLAEELQRTIDMLSAVGLVFHAALAHELAAHAFDRGNRPSDADRHRHRAYQLFRDVGHERAELIELELKAGG